MKVSGGDYEFVTGDGERITVARRSDHGFARRPDGSGVGWSWKYDPELTPEQNEAACRDLVDTAWAALEE